MSQSDFDEAAAGLDIFDKDASQLTVPVGVNQAARRSVYRHFQNCTGR